jgi:hypothetical protein
MTEALPLCPYRQVRLGSLICTVSQRKNEDSTDVVSARICRKCPMPGIIQHVNCINLSVGTFIEYRTDVGQDEEINVPGETNCSVYGFKDRNDFQHMCSTSCPKFTAIHADLSDEPVLEIRQPNSDSDKDLRQIVLEALYAFHARHPERYRRFDVTPEFLAKSLNLPVRDVVRVVAPMEERGEVKTAQITGKLHFSYVYITAKGIESIDAEPLFNTVRVRMDNHVSISNSQGVAVNTGDNSSIAVNFSAEAQRTAQDHLKKVRDEVAGLELEDDVKAGVLDHVTVLEEQAAMENPDVGRVQRALTAAKKVITEIPDLAGKTVLAVKALDKLAELFGGNFVG